MKTQTAINKISLVADEKDVGQVRIVEKADIITKETQGIVVFHVKFRGLDKTITRWQKTTGLSTGPLKSYAKQILE